MNIKTPADLNPGITLIGRFGWLDTGVWLLYHNEECVVVEMPDVDPFANKPYPWAIINGILEARKMNVKFLTSSHCHKDHVNSTSAFNSVFRTTPILWHESFFSKHSYYRQEYINRFVSNEEIQDFPRLPERGPSLLVKGIPYHVWKGKMMSCKVGGEPLHIIHAPKHSTSDTMIIFRGTMITGDWWLGPGDPNNNHLDHQVINESIDRLLEFSKHYRIHSLFSAHANEFRQNLNQKDFESLMESTRPS